MQTGAVDYLSKRHTSSSSSTLVRQRSRQAQRSGASRVFGSLERFRILDKIIGKDNWWKLALESVIEKGYGVDVSKGNVFKSETYINFALAKEKSCPLSRNDNTGHLSSSSAQESLYLLIYM